jgi:hypothetical protein
MLVLIQILYVTISSLVLIQILYVTISSLPITTTVFRHLPSEQSESSLVKILFIYDGHIQQKTIVTVHWLKHNSYLIVLYNKDLHQKERNRKVNR